MQVASAMSVAAMVAFEEQQEITGTYSQHNLVQYVYVSSTYLMTPYLLFNITVGPHPLRFLVFITVYL